MFAAWVLWTTGAVLLRQPERLTRGRPHAPVSLYAGARRVQRWNPAYVDPWFPETNPDQVSWPPGWYWDENSMKRVNASLNVTNNYSAGQFYSNYTAVGCQSQYSFADVIIGDVEAEVTVDYRLMNLSHLDAEVRYCVDFNPNYNGDYFLFCRDGVLHSENSTCFRDVFNPTMVDFHIGVFEPTPNFTLNDTQFINVTTGAREPLIAPWDQFIFRFSEAVQAGSGDIKITELNPPSVRRDYIGPIIDIPADDYYQVFFGAEEDTTGVGMSVVKSKAGHLKSKDGGQMYMLDIPEGAFLDRAGNPAHFRGNATSFNIEFEVFDIRPPQINQDWIAAFWPKMGDTGKFVHHNVTITLDEPVFKRGDPDTAAILLEPRFADDAACYNEFQVHGCGPIYLDEDHAIISLPLYGDQVVMMDDQFTIALYPGVMEYGVTYAVVINRGDFQDASGLNFTGLGTLDQGNYFFTTATPTQMQLREEILFYSGYAKKRLQDTVTMFGVNTPGEMPWVDSFAGLRRLTLLWALGEADKVLAETYGLPVELDLKNIVEELKRDRFEPRGVPFATEWVCDDLGSHFLKDSVSFKCGPAVQKSGNGFDIATRTASFFYREGCLCESFFTNACPFPLTSTQTYRDFGFVAMDQKVISPGHSMCWYWSSSSNPEWGYMSSPEGYYNATDPADDDRLVKQFWSWEAAHRPTEGAPRDMLADHVASQALVHQKPSRHGRVATRAKKETPTQPRAMQLPPSVQGFRLRRAPPKKQTRPQVPVTVRDLKSALAKVLPTIPPEPPADPRRYPKPPGVGQEVLPPGIAPAPTGMPVRPVAPVPTSPLTAQWSAASDANLGVLYR
jgi:hypothetical protein